MAVIKLKKDYFLIPIIFLCLFAMFKYPIYVKEGVINGIEICLYTIIPTLFPFMTLSTYIVKSNVLSPFYKVFSFPSKLLFRQPPCTTSVIIMSMIGGFPVGIKMTNDLYITKRINTEQAQRLCLFCMNGGPAFVITTVGISMLGNIKVGIIIYTSLCIASLISGIISSSIADKNLTSQKNESDISLPLSTLSASISDSTQAITSICSWIVLFSAVTSCLKEFNLNNKFYMILCSLLEVTNGCYILVGNVSIPIIAGIIGFGGVCIHFQILSFLKNMKLNYVYFLISRILNGLLSAIVTQIILIFFPIETDVFSNFNENIIYSFSVSAPTFFVVIIMCIIMILDIDRKKKIC